MFGENIKLIGNPNQKIITQFVNGDVDFVYPFNTGITMSVILETPMIYHCFILEQIERNKQLSYLKIDDGMKYNYIPYYDSLVFDYNFTIVDEKLGSLPSSKFYTIPFLRQKSEKYQQLILSCNDAQELSDFYNKSLYFQCDSNIVSNENKENLLNRLIEILLVNFIQSIGDENCLYSKVFNIFQCQEYYSENQCFFDDISKIDYYFSSMKYIYNKKQASNVPLDKDQSLIFDRYFSLIYNDIINKSSEIYQYYNKGYKIFN
ncbi:MAG: hypothetical protein MJ211_00595 [Bacteroidales bacterium]|nr:hypothetical protein [Bacteroidales bacterium]